VYCIKQAPNGLIYLATPQGIHAFDGYQFTRLKTEGVKATEIRNIEVKSNTTLQIVTRNATLINYDLIKATIADTQKINYSKPIDEVFVIGDYLYGLNDEIEIGCLHLKTNTFTEDAIHKKNRLNQAHCLFKTSKGKVLVGRSDGLYELVNNAQIKLPALKSQPIHAIAETKEGFLVLGTSNKILITDGKKIIKEIQPNYKTKSNTFSLLGERSISKLVVDRTGKIWFTAFPNENIYVYQNNQVTDVNEVLNINPNLINTLFLDKDNNVWIGTFNDGLYFVQNPRFNNTFIQFNQKSIPINVVGVKGNMLFAATQNGLYALNGNNSSVKTISKPDEIFKEQVTDFTFHNGVYYYAKANAFDAVSSILIEGKNNYKLKPIVAKLIYPISENQAVIADYMANVLLVDLKTQKVSDTLISFSDYRTAINAIYYEEQTLYLATSNGLITYDLNTHKPINNSLSKSDAMFYAICKTNDELLISSDEGLHLYHSKRILKNLDNIQLSTIKKITSFNTNIWLVTNNGIIVADKALKPIYLLNKTSGLLSNVVNDLAFDKEMVVIGSNQCITSIRTSLLDSIFEPLQAVEVQKVDIDGKSYLYEKSDAFKMTSSQKEIVIYFSSPCFSQPNKQFYKYRLDGGNWNELDNPRIFLAGLTGGKHEVEITASLDNIKWSEVVKVNLNKEIKFSETVWVYWLAIVGGLSVIGLGSYVWIKRVKRKAIKKIQTEQQVNLLKHQAMNSLLSPHFIFNSLTSIQNYINSNNSLKASEYLAKFSRLIRMIIEKASQSEITLNDEVARLSYYLELEKERFKDKFDYFIEVDPQLNRDLIKIPNMIIQPHAENSIIHGILPKHSHGTLYVRFNKVNETKLIITLEDNGIGLEKAKAHAKTGHKSLGTSTIQSILELNKKISGKSQSVRMVDKSTLQPPQEGTLITIEIEL
jgi:hypothetical protein